MHILDKRISSSLQVIGVKAETTPTLGHYSKNKSKKEVWDGKFTQTIVLTL